MNTLQELIQMQRASKSGNGDVANGVVPGMKIQSHVSARSIPHISRGEHETICMHVRRNYLVEARSWNHAESKFFCCVYPQTTRV